MTSSSSSDSQETLEKCQLEHFLHDHPLIFFENLEEQRICEICNEVIFDGPKYGCIPCSFYVHKSCGELPKQVRNMLHLAHLLELSGEHTFSCDGCNKKMYRCSSYRCMQCDFDLDLQCVLENTFKEPQGHKEHTFKFLKPTLFTCDACGIEEVNKCISCICTTCQLQVHTTCTDSYPFAIKEQRHSHLLKLTYSFQTDHAFVEKICKICFRKMNDVLFIYCCADCAFITHVKCGVSTNTLGDGGAGQVLTVANEVINSNDLESKDTSQQLIKHFSHLHSLILNINGPNNIILCNGCVRPISEAFYSCDRCNFFLHRYCVELKREIQHPLHEHELTLLSDWIDPISSILYGSMCNKIGIECYGCGFLCNGFMYGCEECSFFLDVGCSLLHDILRHEGHACALTLIDTSKRHNVDRTELTGYETKCSACDLNCINKFICERCNFNLDLQCASLPKLVPHQCPKHDWNLHSFELMYYAIDDGRSGKHYCDVCEEERNENHWFYYCKDCDYSAHPRCILGEDRIKYGSLHRIKNHAHIVCFLKEATRNPVCKECLEPCQKDELVFACKECDAHFHCLGCSIDYTDYV